MSNNILTNDPSMTAWGWAIIQNDQVVDFGCIKTEPQSKKRRIRKGDDTTRRASEISRELIRLMERYNIRYIVSELPHGSQNASAAQMIGLVVGLLQATAECYEVGIEWFSEMDAKVELLGKKSATKDETIRAITGKFGWKPVGVKYKDEAVADCLAVYNVATKQSPTVKFLR